MASSISGDSPPDGDDVNRNIYQTFPILLRIRWTESCGDRQLTRCREATTPDTTAGYFSAKVSEEAAGPTTDDSGRDDVFALAQPTM